MTSLEWFLFVPDYALCFAQIKGSRILPRFLIILSLFFFFFLKMNETGS